MVQNAQQLHKSSIGHLIPHHAGLPSNTNALRQSALHPQWSEACANSTTNLQLDNEYRQHAIRALPVSNGITSQSEHAGISDASLIQRRPIISHRSDHEVRMQCSVP